MSRCRSCHQPVLWVKTEAGKSMPLDADAAGHALRVDDGNIAFTGSSVQGVAVVHYVTPGEGLHRSHFASCPHASEHRKPR